MPRSFYPTDELLRGRRALDGIGGVTILKDLCFDSDVQKWVLKCRLRTTVGASEFVPEETDWFILVDATYPWGKIKFNPCKVNGLQETFPHQAFNVPSQQQEKHHWLPGSLCLETTVASLSLRGYDEEPYDVDERLAWHCSRAIEWLDLAVTGQLLRKGDPFELPAYPIRSEVWFGYSENQDTFSQWNTLADSNGFVNLLAVGSGTLVAGDFLSCEDRVLLEAPWGLHFREQPRAARGIWVRLPQMPITPPWRSPSTLGELFTVLEAMEVDLPDIIGRYARHFRNGQRCIVLLGFPLAKTVGENSNHLHWQAFMLPELSREKQSGYRHKEKGLWKRDQQWVLTPNSPVQWLYSRNWHHEQIGSRGRLPSDLRNKRGVMFGTGTIGSVLLDKLVRSGLFNWDILDDDVLETGNLARHILGANEVGRFKASSLASHLNKVFPHASVKGHECAFNYENDEELAGICRAAQLVIDCTGDDRVLQYMGDFDWGSEKLFISISVGYRAHRLFLCSAYASKFPANAFRELLAGWTDVERASYKLDDLPWEGIGCWHPVFPARIDDVSLMVSTAIKSLERLSSSPPQSPTLIVYEQVHTDEEFEGIRLVAKEKLPNRVCA